MPASKVSKEYARRIRAIAGSDGTFKDAEARVPKKQRQAVRAECERMKVSRSTLTHSDPTFQEALALAQSSSLDDIQFPSALPKLDRMPYYPRPRVTAPTSSCGEQED